MTDPFMFEHDEVSQLSMQILQRANAEGIRCSALTKGILPLTLAELPLENEYGITVISLDEEYVHEYETGAAPINERIAARLAGAMRQKQIIILLSYCLFPLLSLLVRIWEQKSGLCSSVDDT